MTITLPDLSRASLDEIIFEGRNQAYGAFDLRRSYDQHMKRAVAITVGLCLLLLGAPLVGRWLERDQMVALPQTPPVTKQEIVLTDKPPIEIPPVRQQAEVVPPVPDQPKTNTQEFTSREIVADDKPVEQVDVASQELLAGIEVGPTTETGGTDTPAAPVTTTAGSGTTTEAAPTEAIFTYIEEMPEYEAGAAAMMKFLARNIHFSPLALRNGIEGKVFLKFVVNERGEVESPQVVKGLGAGLDDEAVRVVKLLRFRPGRQNGRPVKVYFSLPISFQIR